VISGRRTVHEVLERGPAGIQVLPGAWAPADVAECSAAAQQQFLNQLKGLGQYADAIVIDAGSGRHQFVRRFWQAADLVLMVTSPEPVSIMDTYASIKVLLAGEASVPIHTLVNFTPFAPLAADVHARIDQACRRFLGFRTTAAGYLPKDDLISDAAGSGQPFVIRSPRSEAARSVERLAEAIWTQLQQLPRLGNVASQRYPSGDAA
jgi:flagellar biosynthesis protein FlhG